MRSAPEGRMDYAGGVIGLFCGWGRGERIFRRSLDGSAARIGAAIDIDLKKQFRDVAGGITIIYDPAGVPAPQALPRAGRSRFVHA